MGIFFNILQRKGQIDASTISSITLGENLPLLPAKDSARAIATSTISAFNKPSSRL
jgi:hypothetical protein